MICFLITCSRNESENVYCSTELRSLHRVQRPSSEVVTLFIDSFYFLVYYMKIYTHAIYLHTYIHVHIYISISK